MRILLFKVFTLLLIGNSYETFEPFIVGGSKSKILTVPHAVFLHAYCTQSWVCGASVLNQRVLLTAAHCIRNCNALANGDYFVIFAGHVNIEKSKIKRLIIDWVLHKDYKEPSTENDIALIITNKNLPFGKTVKRVIISRRFPKVKEGIVAGWGITDEDVGITSNYLRQTTVKLRPAKFCKRMGARMGTSRFCAGSTDATKDHPSKGDSGSALLAKDGVTQIGLVSYRVGNEFALVAYTNVTYFLKWISKEAKRLYCAHVIKTPHN